MKRNNLYRIIAAVVLFAALLTVFTSCGVKYDGIMEYKGHKLTEDKYYYWLSTYKRNILSSYIDAVDTREFWSTEYEEGKTYADYFSAAITDRVKDYIICEDLFREFGLKLDSSVKRDIKDDINEKIDLYGGKKKLNEELANIKMTVKSIEECYVMEEKLNKVNEYLFGDGGIMSPDSSEIEAYYTENYNRIKYIVIYTTKIVLDENGNYVYDDDGNIMTGNLTEDEMTDKKNAAEECEMKLKNGENFDEVCAKYTEFDVSSYKNGFYISPNEVDIWGDSIISAVRDAEDGAIIHVEEDFAIYIIEKLPLTEFDEIDDADIEQLGNLELYTRQQSYERFFSELRNEVLVDEEVISRYSIASIKANPYYGF